ncbi:HemK methyltransferase family member 1 [Dufourea novaeangliae]|uniref:peptide chain release factor N(5)-glutamine methyltransferase n=2 Tax=Dufourea novaeangliae TaxID=178035 RepID=A0A154NWU4_DUFNO|nr:HemK methyltransferase family member 1 [Dufourea novaeangliae]
MLTRSILSARTFAGIVNIEARLYRTKSITFCRPTRRLYTVNAQCSNVGEIIKQWSQRFENEGVPEPVESIEYIVAHVLGIKKPVNLTFAKHEELTLDQCNKLETLCECRLSRMPVQYIIGEWDFRDITLKLVPPIFIPRPETEILVDFVLKRIGASQNSRQEVLEVGCGSGAISLAIAHANKTVNCVAIDTNRQACELCMENRDALDLKNQVHIVHATVTDNGTVQLSDILSGSENLDLNSKTFDFIVSNPPYICTHQIPALEPEIKIYEDLRAINGGDDGLKVIKPLLKYAAAALKPGGRLFLEVDASHPEYIKFFTEKYPNFKLQYEHTYKDFCNFHRFVEVLKIA